MPLVDFLALMHWSTFKVQRLSARLFATWWHRKSPTGCLPFGSLLTAMRRQSATRHCHTGRLSFGSRRIQAVLHRPSRHRQVGCPPFGGQRVSSVVHSCWRVRQNLWQFKQKGVAQCKGHAKMNTVPLACSLPTSLASLASLTGRSTGTSRAAHVPPVNLGVRLSFLKATSWRGFGH
jgi:hypothetical protein